jgi:nicotinic acid mononucleotide adenylyltransferase
MNKHDALAIFFAFLFVAFAIWTVLRGRRWDKHQADARTRAKAITDAMERDRERAEQALAISQEHLQVTKETLAEIKAIREDLKKRG